MAKDEDLKGELAAEVRRTLDPSRLVDVEVIARNNASDEPAFYVAVTVPTGKDRPSIAVQNQLVWRMWGILKAHDDERFPYLYFDALDDTYVELEAFENEFDEPPAAS